MIDDDGKSSKRRPMTWAETVRPWETYKPAGLRRIETSTPDMTGIRFDRDRPRTDEEKKLLMAHGLTFFNEPQAWLKMATPESRDETKELARKIAEQRTCIESKDR